MLYAIQSDVFAFLRAVGLRDADGFAAQAAQLYATERSRFTTDAFLTKLLAVRTSTFSTRRRQRRPLTQNLLARLDKKFKRAVPNVSTSLRPKGAERRQVIRLTARAKRKRGEDAFNELMIAFKASMESHGVEAFWKSRRKSELRPRPEQIAQVSLMMFLSEPLRLLGGFPLREVRSGVGYIDVMAVFGKSRRYLVELKVRSTPRVSGTTQLARYLATEGLSQGWLVILDARETGTKVPKTPLAIDGTTIRVVNIDINPVVPSAYSRSYSPKASGQP